MRSTVLALAVVASFPEEVVACWEEVALSLELDLSLACLVHPYRLPFLDQPDHQVLAT